MNTHGTFRKLKPQLVVVCVAFVVLFASTLFPAAKDTFTLQTIGRNVKSFDDLKTRFVDLANRKGAEYAYSVLLRAQLPAGTDLHLLGHAVGDVLYQQKGVAGIADCTQDFRNACSHSIAIGALNEFGDAALEKIHDACKKAPGGSGAYTMCYHGLGHGVFAYFAYDFPKTIDFCKKTGTSEYNNQEYVQCVGGSIMELIDGGGHNHDAWLVARQKYLSISDPLAPCDTNVIPAEAKSYCYTYVTPNLFVYAGGSLASPTPKDFEKAFEYCDKIPPTNLSERRSCFGGIGKEFPLLAVARDTRALSSATDDELATMRTWCKTAPHDEAYSDCTDSIVDSLFWGGENDPLLSIRFCDQAKGDDRKECFGHLFLAAKDYLLKESEKKALCAAVPEDMVQRCRI